MGKGLILVVGLLLSARSWAQFDSSSTVLLKPSGGAPAHPALDSTRYKVRVPESHRDDDLEETPGTYIASPVPRSHPGSRVSVTTKVSTSTSTTTTSNPAVVAPLTPVASPLPVIVTPEPAPPEPEPAPAPVTRESVEILPPLVPVTPPTPPAPTLPPGPASPNEPAAPTTEHPPVTVQVRELILGDDQQIDEYQQRVHPEDPRANVLTISAAPAYFYNGSSSNYSFRHYHANGPGFGLGVNAWFTPFFGLQGTYFSSIAGSVRDASGMVEMDTEELDLGVRFRKHFGYSRESAQLLWGVDYHSFSDHIAKDATTLVGAQTTGVSLVLEGIVPANAKYAHTFSTALRPWQRHAEPATGADARSGLRNQTGAVSFDLGGQWTLDRRNQLYWKGEYTIERNLFKGSATEPDLHDQTPDGVSVTNSLLIFYFGFRWGS